MMKHVALAAGLLLVAGQAEAISRYNSTSMSCAGVQQTIKAEGAAIMRYPGTTNPSLTRYDRYVAHGGFCSFGEVAKYTYIPTADAASCQVLHCVTPNFDDDRLFHRHGFGILR